MAIALLDNPTKLNSTDLIFESLNNIPNGTGRPNSEALVKDRRLTTAARQCLSLDNLVVHEEIKRGGAGALEHIENFKATLLNLSKCGIKTVGYNFDPLFHKVHTHITDLRTDQHGASLFDPVAFATFDIYILKRLNAERTYNSYQRQAASLFNRRLSEQEKYQLSCNIFSCLQARGIQSLNALRKAIDAYRMINNHRLTQNLELFRSEIAPAAKKAGIKLVFQSGGNGKGLCGLPFVL